MAVLKCLANAVLFLVCLFGCSFNLLHSLASGEDILRNAGSQTVLVTIDTETFFKIYTFMFCTRKEVIQVWNDMVMNKLLPFFLLHFYMNYPFKILLIIPSGKEVSKW